MATRVLESDAHGLTAAEVADRLADGRSNAVPARTSRSVGAILRADLPTCGTLTEGGMRFTGLRRTAAAADAERLGAGGMRVLMLASRDHPLDNEPDASPGVEQTCATVTLCSVSLWVLVLVARPLRAEGDADRGDGGRVPARGAAAVREAGLRPALRLVGADADRAGRGGLRGGGLELLWRFGHGRDAIGKTGDSREIRG